MAAEIVNIGNSSFKIEYDKYSEVEIGGDTEDFKPEALLKKWGDECFIKVSLPTTKNIVPLQEDGKIKWKDTDKEIHLYPLEPREFEENGRIVKQLENGGFEFEVILKKKPKTNKIVLNIETKGLKFYYQPDERDDPNVFQPENVVGSYAVYHATKGNMHPSEEEAEKYKVGKFGHFFRPKATDANGDWIWCDLYIDEKTGISTITIPQDFLDNAIYPIRHAAGLTFGYTSIGGTERSGQGGTNWGVFYKFTFPADVGTATNVKLYGHYGTAGKYFKALIVNSSKNIITNAISPAVSIPTASAWMIGTFATPPILTPNDIGYLGEVADYEKDCFYDTVAESYSYLDTSNNYTTPTNPTDMTDDYNNRLFSIYATYTPTEGENVEVTPAVISATFGVQAPTVTYDYTVTATVLTSTFSIQASVAGAGTTIEPAVLTITFGVQAPTVTYDYTISPTVLSATFNIQAPTVSYDYTISPSILSAIFSIQTPAVSLGATISPTVLSLTFGIQSPTITYGAGVTPTVLTATFTVQEPVVGVDIGITISPAVQTLTFTIQAPAISFTSHGVDTLDWSNKYASPYLITLNIAPDRYIGKTFKKYTVAYISKPTSTDITMSYLKNTASPVALTTRDMSDEQVLMAHQNIDVGLLQLKLEPKVSGNNAPEIYEIASQYNNKLL